MNLKTKLMKCCANLYFNRQCLIKKLIPKYADIKIPNTSPAADYTSKKIRNIRIKDEIKFLYKKKQQLNKDIYHAHLEVTKEWGNLWTLIHESVIEKINVESEKKYETIIKKRKQLEATQSKNPKQQKKFYPRVVNKTNIDFTNEEMTVLNKGLKYNLSHKNKNWIETLALEAETALSLLPSTEQDYIRCHIANNIRQLYNKSKFNHPINTITMKREKAVINKLKKKLDNNEAMITKADKGNSIVIIYQNTYQDKVLQFIKDNNFTNMTNDPTQNFQKKNQENC
jgi:hypothetical protein